MIVNREDLQLRKASKLKKKKKKKSNLAHDRRTPKFSGLMRPKWNFLVLILSCMCSSNEVSQNCD